MTDTTPSAASTSKAAVDTSGSGKDAKEIIIGVLALQGAFVEHVKMFRRLGVNTKEVRSAKDLEDIDGLVIPGGESTAIGHLIKSNHLEDDLRGFVMKCKRSASASVPAKAVWGTCAGMILLSDRGEGLRKEGQFLLGGLDVVVVRNYFGSQIGSFRQDITFPSSKAASKEDASSKESEPFHAVFIRAPAITEIGKDVEILSRICKKSDSFDAKGTGEDEVIVAVKQGNILATAFHPELTSDSRWHEYFLDLVHSIHHQ